MSSSSQKPQPDNGYPSADTHGNPRISTDAPPGTGRMLMVGIVAMAIVLAIAFTIEIFVRRHDANAADRLVDDNAAARPAVEVVIAQPSPASYPLQLPGETKGWYQGPIYARVDGYVASWLVDIGTHVKQGQVLATIDTPELDQQKKAAEAKAAASEAQTKVAESNVSIARLTYERWRDSPRGVVSEQEREEKKATYDSAGANLQEAKAQAQLDEAEVSRYSAMEGFRNLTAPYDGVIIKRHIDIGYLVTAGSSGDAYSLYEIAQMDKIRVFTDIPQKAAGEIMDGLAASVTCDQYPGQTFSGTVDRSSMSMDPQTRTQRTEVDIPNPDLKLKPDMYVQVAFQLKQLDLPVVPASAVMARATGQQVAVVGDDNKIHFHAITIAKDNGDTVVIGSGVSPGDRVALNLSSAIVDGEEVNPQTATATIALPPPAPPPAKKGLPKLETTAPVASLFRHSSFGFSPAK